MDVVESGQLDLVERTRAGDPEAFEALMVPLQAAGYRLARVMLGDAQAAEDAVQEACCRAWQKFHQFRYGSSPQAWFLAIVANQCRGMLRARWWSVWKRPEIDDRRTSESEPATMIALRGAFQLLPFGQRLAVYLYYCEDKSQDEIAAMLGVAKGTVKSRIHRGLAALRRELEMEEAG